MDLSSELANRVDHVGLGPPTKLLERFPGILPRPEALTMVRPGRDRQRVAIPV
jgi:hypothetical protein